MERPLLLSSCGMLKSTSIVPLTFRVLESDGVIDSRYYAFRTLAWVHARFGGCVALTSWLKEIPTSPSECVILSGAGISVDGPSCIPPGLGVTRRVLVEAAGLTSDEIAQLAGLFEECRMPGGFPRFETVLGAAAESLGEEGLAILLRDIIDISPNDLHSFFATHLAAGGKHITANIDCGIERAGASVGVIHFHGATDGGDDLRRLGITLRNVEDGFPVAMEEALRTVLLSSSTRAIVVVGYSGSDYFDMTPFLEGLSLNRDLAGKKVLWFEFDPHDARLRVDESHLAPTSTTSETIQLLRTAGAVVAVVRGNVRSGLERLAVHWGLPPGNLSAAPVDCGALAAASFSPRQQTSVRVTLFDRLGHLPGLELEERRDPWSQEWAAVHAMADWNRGRYRAAAARWQQCFNEDLDRDLLREERAVACNWVSGRYLRAMLGLRRLLAELETTRSVSVSTRLVIADTGARLWEHVRRIPDVRWLATDRLRRRLLATLPTIDEAMSAQLSPDVLDRLRVAHTKVDPAFRSAVDLEALLRSAYDRNSQSSSIVRTHNYLQGSVRQSASSGRESDADILRLWDAWRRLGAHGETVRLLTVPGSTQVLGVRNSLKHVWSSEVDYAFYHRIRIMVLITALHFRRRQLGSRRGRRGGASRRRGRGA